MIRRLIRWLGVLSLLGGMSALLIIIVFAATEWGLPGTVAYQR